MIDEEPADRPAADNENNDMPVSILFDEGAPLLHGDAEAAALTKLTLTELIRADRDTRVNWRIDPREHWQHGDLRALADAARDVVQRTSSQPGLEEPGRTSEDLL